MIRREVSIFLFVGSLTVLVDYFSYRGLLWSGLFSIHVAKAMGFLIGTTFAYFANRIWTFGHKSHAPGSGWRFILVYSTTLLTNVMVNSIALSIFAGMLSGAFQVAFLLATCTSAILNFLGMKFFVFKVKTTSAPI